MRAHFDRSSETRAVRYIGSSGEFGLLFAAVFTLLSSPIDASCPRWDVSGKWNIEQENPTALVELDVTQTGTEITGTAKYNGAAGTLKGTITGADFRAEIHVGKEKHLFRGTVGPARITGINSAPHVAPPTIWASTREMRCVEAEPASRDTAKAAGGSTSSNPADGQRPASAGKIWANPQVPTVPAGQVEGRTTLAWDAGKEHPNAEVWLKIDDENEKLLVKQAKGSRDERLKPNKVYYYILKDAGRQLDSVTVTAVD